MSTVRVDIFDSFQDAEPRWRLYQERCDHFAYQTFEWVTSWHRHVGQRCSIDLCLVDIVDADGTPLAFLPLGVERRRFGAALIWLGGDIADYHGPILTPEGAGRLDAHTLDLLWAALRKQLPTAAYADFKRQPSRIGTLTNPFATVGRKAQAQLALSTELTDDWPTYYTGKRSKKTRHNDRRKRRKLEGMGDLSFVVAASPDEIDAQITVMLEQKDRYVARLGQTNVLRQPGQADFLKRMTEGAMMDQTTMLCALKLNDRIVAVQWGIIHQRRLYSIIASYDDGPLNRYSTGDILLRELFAWCFDNDVEIVDFTCGDEPYKLAWCDRSLDLQDRLLPMTASGRIIVMIRLLTTRLRRWARSSPALHGVVTGLRRRVRNEAHSGPSASTEMSARQTGSNIA